MTNLINIEIKNIEDFQKKSWQPGDKLYAKDLINMSKTINKNKESIAKIVSIINDFIGDTSVFNQKSLNEKFNDFYTKSETDKDISKKIEEISRKQLNAVNNDISSSKLDDILAEIKILHTALNALDTTGNISKAVSSEGSKKVAKANIENVLVSPDVNADDIVIENIEDEIENSTISGSVIIITGSSEDALTFEVV